MSRRAWILAFALATGASAEESRISALVRQLDDDDYRVREAAEEELFTMGPSVAADLERAIPAAGAEGEARLRRILAWVGPDWGVAAEARARVVLEDRFSTGPLRCLPLEGERLEPLRDICRIFILRVPDETARGSHEQVFAVWRDRAVTDWSGEESRQALLAAGLGPEGEPGRSALVAVRDAVAAFLRDEREARRHGLAREREWRRE